MIDTDFRLHTSIGFRLARLTKIMSNQLDRKLEEIGMTRMKWCVLASVGLQGIETSSELADYIGITRQATSRVLVRMRKEKLISQTLDEDDARSRQIVLTPLGRKTLKKCLPIVQNNHALYLHKLSADRLASLDDIVEELLIGEITKIDSF